MKPRDMKMKTLTVKILTSNFERAIECMHGKQRASNGGTSSFRTASRLQWTHRHPLACDDNKGVWQIKVSQVHWAATLDRWICRQPGGYTSFFEILRQQQGPRRQHCRRGTLSPLCIASTEHRRHIIKCMCNARGCGNVQVHTKNKIRKFLLKAFHPFIRKFAPAKISRYTVCDTRSLRVNNRTMNLNNSVAHIQTQTYHGYEWMTFRLVERVECCHGRDKTNPRTLFHHSSQRYSRMLPCHTLDNGNQLQRRRGGRQCFKKVLLFARGKCTSLMNN